MNKLRLLDFDDLLILRDLLRGETLSSAAKSLGLTQPAVTQRIRKIESLLNFQLLEKHGRQARLTHIGERFARKVIPILEQLEAMENEPAIEVMSVGIAVDNLLLPMDSLMLSLGDERRDIVCDFMNGTPDDLQARLSHHKMSAVVATNALSDSRFVSLPIKSVDLLSVGSKKDTHSEQPEQLVFIAYPGIDVANFRANGVPVKFKNVWQVASAQFALQAVAKGLGITLIPKSHFLRRLDMEIYKEVAFAEVDILPVHLFLQSTAEGRDNEFFLSFHKRLQQMDVVPRSAEASTQSSMDIPLSK